jgi:hypothetical protein
MIKAKTVQAQRVTHTPKMISAGSRYEPKVRDQKMCITPIGL